MMFTTDAELAAEARVRDALRQFVEARRELTQWRLQQFVAREIDTLGGAGFVKSVGDALRAGAMAAESSRNMNETKP
jgi:hypothetical protein